MITIDGSQGEGGGQILRTTVGLAAALGLDVKITGIRANRSKPGLRSQHIEAVEAAAAVCNAHVEGVAPGATEVVFRPRGLRAGGYSFDIGTAGSTVLVAQTVIPALMLADGQSQVTIYGGTHNPLAPCFEYLRDVYAVLASAANLHAYFELARTGFYPAGGGQLDMSVLGLAAPDNVAPIRLVSRGELKYIEGVSAVGGGLPGEIAHRQADQALKRLAADGYSASLEQANWPATSPGTVLFLRMVFERTVAGFFSLGAKGKRAEQVADEAVDSLLAFASDEAAVVDAHAADPLITLAALSPQESCLACERITAHLATNAEVIRQLTGREISIDGKIDQPGTVRVCAK